VSFSLVPVLGYRDSQHDKGRAEPGAARAPNHGRYQPLAPNESDLRAEVVLREGLLVGLHEAHRLCARGQISVRDLDNEPMILYPNVPTRGLAQEIISAFHREGARLRIEQDVEDVLTCVALVSSGFGLCITTESTANLRLPHVVYRPLKSRYLRDIDLSCLYRRGDSSPILTAFMSVVRHLPAKRTRK
jgi:LysR family transcriptional regulator, benzoate and cis,cis-muconate-responsive activator of ben and cat genes